MFELNARILGGETPVNSDGFLVAPLLPSLDLSLQFSLRVDALA